MPNKLNGRKWTGNCDTYEIKGKPWTLTSDSDEFRVFLSKVAGIFLTVQVSCCDANLGLRFNNSEKIFKGTCPCGNEWKVPIEKLYG